MAVRDMDIAAELIGIRLFRAKLLAFAVSSFYIGVAGAMMVFLWLGAAEPEAFNIDLSFQLLFMIIIGGLGSILGAFLGAAIIHLLPIALRALPAWIGWRVEAATVEQLTFMATGALIIGVLIAEPRGLAQLWRTTKQKLRVWPFPY
jgi:branched-chain amino acid transport system permease protein